MDFPEVDSLARLDQVFPLFLRKKERVMLCFPGREDPVGQAVAECVERCGGVPVFWGQDLRWKTLLRKAFQEHCFTIVGAPSVLLGLSKLKKRVHTPLYIRNAVILGDAPDPWMSDSIRDGFDCSVRCWIPGREMSTGYTGRMAELVFELRRWSTILDLKLDNLGSGLSLELVTFPGEKLPKLPSFARLVVRNWDGERDIPLDVPLQWRTGIFSSDNH